MYAPTTFDNLAPFGQAGNGDRPCSGILQRDLHARWRRPQLFRRDEALRITEMW